MVGVFAFCFRFHGHAGEPLLFFLLLLVVAVVVAVVIAVRLSCFVLLVMTLQNSMSAECKIRFVFAEPENSVYVFAAFIL